MPPAPYLYGGSSRESAIFETVFHNVPIDAPYKFVDLGNFANRAYGQIVQWAEAFHRQCPGIEAS